MKSVTVGVNSVGANSDEVRIGKRKACSSRESRSLVGRSCDLPFRGTFARLTYYAEWRVSAASFALDAPALVANVARREG